ncbi:MAG: S8 family serine peptidase [Methyloversatilis sp.]|jgi:subtilisin family serine protease|nr:S8 family serine peptidase [Methyloversatilis sp.]
MNWVDRLRVAGLVGAIAGLAAALCAPAFAQSPEWPERVRRAQQDLKPPPVQRSVGKSFSLAEPGAIGDELRREIEARSSAKHFAPDAALAVTLVAQPDRERELASLVESLGGEVEATVDSEVFARVSPAVLDALARRIDVLKLAVPQGEAVGQQSVAVRPPVGMQTSPQVAALHASGVSGRGVRLAVIDAGSGVSGFEAGSHGAACTALVRSVAPDASIVEIGVDRLTEGRLLQAMEQARRIGAQVVSLSAAGYDFPLDGSAAPDRAMKASRQGATPLWIVAAGNQADLHWHGSVRDANANGWIDVPEADAPADTSADQLLIRVVRAGRVRITANWNDWAAFRGRRTFSDLDAYLYRVDDGAVPVLVARSELDQSAGARPVERIDVHLEPGDYLLGLRATRLLAHVALHVFVEGNVRLQPAHAERSLGVPGTAAAALTVGVLAEDGETYASYSGRGPTEDGRRKPDAATRLPAGNTFAGTSAATPFLAGMAALVAQRNPALNGMALKQKVLHFIRPVREGRDILALDADLLRADLLKAR